MSIQVGNGTTENVVIGAAPSGGAAANTIYTGSGVEHALRAGGGYHHGRHRGHGIDGDQQRRVVEPVADLQNRGSAGTLTVTSSIVRYQHTRWAIPPR